MNSKEVRFIFTVLYCFCMSLRKLNLIWKHFVTLYTNESNKDFFFLHVPPFLIIN